MAPSAYARLRESIRREEARMERDKGSRRYKARLATMQVTGIPKKPSNASGNVLLHREKEMARNKPTYCGAKKRDGSSCRMAAGFGTNHLGLGCCKHHGGASPTAIKAANRKIATKEAVLLGAPREINPLDAIIWCIQIKAGEVQWLSEKIVDLEERDWIEDSLAGRRFNLFARHRDEATKSLVEFSKIAISLGLAERAVKLAEQYGTMLANLIKGILGDLNLTAEQQAEAPRIVRKHLILVQGGLAQGQLPPGYKDEEEVAS